jgi:hypothetical protein
VPPRAGAPESESVLLERCELCGLGIAADLGTAEAAATLLAAADELPGRRLQLRAANRRSVQASLGGSQWAALEPGRRLYLTPQSLRLLALRAGLDVEESGSPAWGRGQAWMWLTIVNALTLNRNFAREVRTGRLRPGGIRRGVSFAIDALVTTVVALPVALLAAPLELLAAVVGRGGELVALAVRR